MRGPREGGEELWDWAGCCGAGLAGGPEEPGLCLLPVFLGRIAGDRPS